VKKIADSGYQGGQNIHKNMKIPIKKQKNKSLNFLEKLYN